MSKKSLELRTYKGDYKNPKKKLNCTDNSKSCKNYETAWCDYSCPYAQQQKEKELDMRKPKSTYIRK